MFFCMKFFLGFILWIALLGVFGCAAGVEREKAEMSATIKQDIVAQKGAMAVFPKRAAVLDAATKTANLLLALLGNNGKFTYRFDLNPQRKFKYKYNVLRHSGSIYALGQWHDVLAEANERRAVRAKIESGVRFLNQCCLVSIDVNLDKKNPIFAIGSFPEVNGSGNPPVAKLGGTGLSLMAYAVVQSVQPLLFLSVDEMASLGGFILFMQKGDGQFYSKFQLDSMTLDKGWNSLYYPGEAALGLLKLYAIDNDSRWFDGANKALLYLANSRKNQIDIPHDHWAMIATAELLRHKGKLSSKTKAAHLRHVRQLSRAIMSRQIKGVVSNDLYGAFDTYGKTTPAATRVEGLVAAYEILTCLKPAPLVFDSDGSVSVNDIELTKKIARSIAAGVVFLMRAQIKEGPNAGAIPRAIGPIEGTRHGAEKFNRRATEVRIDYLQHALSAFIGFLNNDPGISDQLP